MRQLLSIAFFGLLSVTTFGGPNGKFVYHTVEKGETLYSISRQYGLMPKDLSEYNDALGNKQIVQVGQKLKIPYAESGAEANMTVAASISTIDATQPASSESYHIVKSGETVYHISKMHNIPTSQLVALNKIKGNNISVGQRLILKNEGNTASIEKQDPPHEAKVSTAIPDDVIPATLAATKTVKSWKSESIGEVREYYKAKPDASAAEYESLYYQNIYPGMKLKAEAGLAKVLADKTSSNIAYYNNAPIGTILKLTNTDNGKCTYAIVVGNMPQTEENCLVKLSGKVASSLSAKDHSNIQIFCYNDN